MSIKRLGVLVSGGGSNLQAIIDSCVSKELNAAVCVVISSKPDVYALQRANNHGIDSYVVQNKDFDSRNLFTLEVCKLLQQYDVDYVVLAGFTLIFTPEIVEKYTNRIINIHPSLIPKHCGKGYWGMNVHNSVIQSGDKQSGATAHFVDEGCDTGQIILQYTVDVDKTDTAQTLQKKVLDIEHILLVDALKKLCNLAD